MKKQTEHSPAPIEMENSALHQLFLDELTDIYWAEKHLVKNLPNAIRYATSDDLKEIIQVHLYETDIHIERLEMIFERLGDKASEKRCDAMESLIAEFNNKLRETEDGTMVRDVVIISCSQKIEHYEIATYGTLHTLAETMNHNEIADLLLQTLHEEKSADARLTEIAMNEVNEQAKIEQK